jgi:hypothetical protein
LSGAVTVIVSVLVPEIQARLEAVNTSPLTLVQPWVVPFHVYATFWVPDTVVAMKVKEELVKPELKL